ncbi:MAG TPA: hypothetical protein VNB49_04500 [Candidatus Dormibacteraeota bacterium]|nr:hypothetical protein [Candidatus Dormibacteraeota bacterium]
MEAILCFITVFGIYRFDPRTRVLGILLAVFFCFDCTMILLISPSLAQEGWLITAATVLSWFFWPEARAQFARAKEKSQAA